jgi:cytochrome c oxidase cbb3-type subunit III
MKTGIKDTHSFHRAAQRIAAAGVLTFLHFSSMAQEKASELPATAAATAPEKATLFDSPVFIGMLSLAIILMVVILVFAEVAKTSIRFRTEQDNKKRSGENLLKALLVLVSSTLLSGTVFAQADTATAAAATTGSPATSDYWGMDGTTFYALAALIAFEMLVAWKLYSISMQMLGAEKRRQERAAAKRLAKAQVKRPTLMEKLNQSVAIEKEADIMLDHNYDGIRELDNNLPPWWKYGFYVSIVFSFVYVAHYHLLGTGKLQIDEYEDQLLQAKYEMAAYRKKAANLVDENNATVLTDAGSIAAGKAAFNTNCAACHGANGEGGVGPNLTDDYWLHGGDIKDVFRTIKFGYPEKGMKAWQQDLGARQIHETASYIASLRGSKPANAKEPQGDLYVPADSTKTND